MGNDKADTATIKSAEILTILNTTNLPFTDYHSTIKKSIHQFASVAQMTSGTETHFKGVPLIKK